LGLEGKEQGMTKIVIDAALRGKLSGLKEAAQLIDESGHVLGDFLPARNPKNREPQIDEEEVKRRLKAGGGRGLAEILADLENGA
jgi:hypothetical protein